MIENLNIEKVTSGVVKITFTGDLAFNYDDDIYQVKEIIIYGKSIH
jgi:hypothetical protein